MYPSDVLSDVFQSLRLGGGLYFTARFGRHYAVAIPAEGRTIRFHLVRRGSCWLSQGEKDAPIKLHPGDLAIVPNGAGHVLSDDPDLLSAPLSEVIKSGAVDTARGELYFGTGEQTAVVLCGFCSFDEKIRHPVIDLLADRLLLTTAAQKQNPALLSAIRLLGDEADGSDAGRSGILSRLLEIIFIQAMRFQGIGQTEKAPAFIRALADDKLSRALGMLHRNPDRAWTTALLAREAGMSRTRFAVKFSQMVGQAPMTYLANWRLSRARLLLRDTNLAIDEIGRRCGYQSLPSFTRRFKAVFGEGPGAFRRGLRSGK